MINKPVRLTDTQFVAIPNFYRLDKQPIKYLDILIYTSLKSFDNADEDCFPMHETIAKRAGMSKRFVVESIKRLEQAGLITVVRSAKKKASNHYFFNSQKRFEQIPFDLFTKVDLTSSEKAMLVCLRQFFVHGPLKCIDDVPFFCKWLGLSYETIYPIYKSLVGKGYINEKMKVYRNSNISYIVRTLTDKILWKEMGCVSSLLEKVKFESVEYPKLKVA